MTSYELTLLENVERSAKSLQRLVHKDLEHYEVLVDLINHMLSQIDLIKYENENETTD